MSRQVEPHIESFPIRSYESTSSGHVAVQSLCNYLQEAAGNHARQLGVSIEQLVGENLTWVLGKLRLEVDDLPVWRDEVEIETWPSDQNGLIAMRDFVLRTGGREFGRATSAWFMLNIDRRRPVRLPASMVELQLPVRPPTLSHDFPAPSLPDAFEYEIEFRVRYSDLDMNNHVNNVRYVEWALESIPREMMSERQLRTLEVHFKAETVEGQMVRAQTTKVSAESSEFSFVHRLSISGTDREVALLTTTWAERPSA